jgi:hypothetical protein
VVDIESTDKLMPMIAAECQTAPNVHLAQGQG